MENWITELIKKNVEIASEEIKDTITGVTEQHLEDLMECGVLIANDKDGIINIEHRICSFDLEILEVLTEKESLRSLILEYFEGHRLGDSKNPGGMDAPAKPFYGELKSIMADVDAYIEECGGWT